MSPFSAPVTPLTHLSSALLNLCASFLFKLLLHFASTGGHISVFHQLLIALLLTVKKQRQREKMMEKNVVLVCLAVGFLGVLAAALGFAAEATRIKVMTDEFCIMRGLFLVLGFLEMGLF